MGDGRKVCKRAASKFMSERADRRRFLPRGGSNEAARTASLSLTSVWGPQVMEEKGFRLFKQNLHIHDGSEMFQ